MFLVFGVWLAFKIPREDAKNFTISELRALKVCSNQAGFNKVSVDDYLTGKRADAHCHQNDMKNRFYRFSKIGDHFAIPPAITVTVRSILFVFRIFGLLHILAG